MCFGSFTYLLLINDLKSWPEAERFQCLLPKCDVSNSCESTISSTKYVLQCFSLDEIEVLVIVSLTQETEEKVLIIVPIIE